MNRDDIIRMALEVDFRRDNKGLYSPPISDITPLLERFAALVAAAERKACAKVCHEIVLSDYTLWTKPYAQGGLERDEAAIECANKILARGEK